MTKSHHDSIKLDMPPLAPALRIVSVIVPALRDTTLFWLEADAEIPRWCGERFQIVASATCFEVWATPNHLVLDLRRSRFGLYELVLFDRGGWERDLLLYVGARAGALGVRESM